jgi:hypothetical protein
MHLGDPKADEEKILKWILDYEVEDWIELSQSSVQ